jgi:2-polyprenyl-3-methyl-5-hydroxy-6-metoxy-1,4-benzoquinol methylase
MSDRTLFGSCPLCNSKVIANTVTGDCSTHPLYSNKLNPKIQWQECGECNHVFTEGFYTEEACAIIFSKTHTHQKVGGPIEQNRYVSSKMVEKVLPFASEGFWLDVGFGNGSLLFTAQEYGFKPIGIDLRIENVNILKSLGIESYCEDLANLALPRKMSVISMADVLEHMPYPQKALLAAYNLLEENGVLLVSMPNSENILWKALSDQKQNPYWGEMEHYHNFSRTRLYELLHQFGFEPVRYGISERYRVCMEVVSVKKGAQE